MCVSRSLICHFLWWGVGLITTGSLSCAFCPLVQIYPPTRTWNGVRWTWLICLGSVYLQVVDFAGFIRAGYSDCLFTLHLLLFHFLVCTTGCKTNWLWKQTFQSNSSCKSSYKLVTIDDFQLHLIIFLMFPNRMSFVDLFKFTEPSFLLAKSSFPIITN